MLSTGTDWWENDLIIWSLYVQQFLLLCQSWRIEILSRRFVAEESWIREAENEINKQTG